MFSARDAVEKKEASKKMEACFLKKDQKWPKTELNQQ
jgi:hypothetical protein